MQVVATVVATDEHGRVHCRYCNGEHAKAAELKACWQRGGRPSELEQIRAHGLAASGLTHAPANKADRAAELRANQTSSELDLGIELLTLRWKFFAQVPRRGYILDFYAPEVSLAIEVDGASHRDRETADQLRDDALAAAGIQVLRFTADDVQNDVAAIVRTVKQAGRKRQGKRDWQDLLDAEWHLYRYGTEEPEAEPGPPPRVPEPAFPKCRWTCLDCDRTFGAPIKPPAQCRDNPSHKVRAVCKRCNRPTATTPPVCDPCRDAADVAREAAGPGAHAPGHQLPQARKAKKWS
jgi:very-short-patch-repair endonuclease